MIEPADVAQDKATLVSHSRYCGWSFAMLAHEIEAQAESFGPVFSLSKEDD